MNEGAVFVGSPEVALRFPDLHPPFTAQSALVEANRCLNCFDAPCTLACPTHIDVPKFIKKIASGNLRGSAAAILDANILGGSCSRVCPVDVLCQGACVLNRYNEKPIEIGRLQRYAMDNFFERGGTLPLPGRETQCKVACIGAGPASLACAAELRKHGHQVTIFERQALPGGLNTYGVAEYKLRSEDSLREIELIRALGVEFQFGVAPSLDDLEARFDLIFIGAGLGQMKKLGIENDSLPGVIDALAFIAGYKTGGTLAVGRAVAVIGAGNTAIDAANAAKRLGAEEVDILYRRGEDQMSAFSFEFEHAKQEGVRFQWFLSPKRIEPQPNGAGVAAIDCINTLTGEQIRIPCDMVITAIGQSPLHDLLDECRGVEVSEGRVLIDRETGRTANPKYFAGGDCVNGGREVVDAVADGKRAGMAMAKALENAHA